ncbi:MAG: hypothetical protein EPN19_15435 [Betaproteobacteria bacterium]|nr:MAG: hypothetical protein EPN19_15435 [Betaproteobacteria bacterium]
MSESQAPGKPRTHVLCLLPDGPTAEALRWTQALAHSHEVELVDLTQPGLAYSELLQRIFASDRVISW